MTLDTLLIKLQTMLQRAVDSPIALADPTIEAFGEACKTSIRKQFIEDRNDERFRIRMSNIGKPLCQLQMEMGKAKREKPTYNQRVQNTFGDMLEALVVLLIKGSGLEVQSEQEKVSLDIGGINLEGTYDIELEDAIWDIKSVSPYSWETKFGPSRSFRDIAKDDPFGYVSQGVLYGTAAGKVFGGWISINKATGELNVVRAPLYDEYFVSKTLSDVDGKIRALTSCAPFTRQYTDIEETFRRKTTGNRVLGITCSYCPYKQACWGKMDYKPAVASDAQNPKWYYYTFISEEWRKRYAETETEGSTNHSEAGAGASSDV